MRKIHKKWQLLLYAASGMGINMLNLMMGSYLCSALLVGGFGADAVPYQTFAQRDLIVAAAWAIFVLAAKIFDGIVDIPLASVVDNLRTRWGRRRPAIAVGLVLVLMAYMLFLVIPSPSGVSWLNTIYYGVMLCIFYSCYTVTMLTYYATFTEIVETERERTILSNVKSVCDILYFILGYVLVPMLLNGLNIRIVALIVMPLALTMLIPLFMIKEPDMRKGNVQQERTRSVNLIQSFRYTVKNRDFMVWMVVYFFMNFGVQLFLGGINEYFSFVGLNMVVVMGGTFAPVPLALIIHSRIHRRWGFGVSFRYALFAYAFGMLAMFGISFLPGGTGKTLLSIGAGLFCSLAIGALFAVAYSVPSQLAAVEQEKTGVSNAAMYFAVQGVFSGVATGLATGVVLTALKGSEESRSGAILYLTLIAAIGILIAAVFMFFQPKAITEMGKSPKQKK